MHLETLADDAAAGRELDAEQLQRLGELAPLGLLMRTASVRCGLGHAEIVTYSPKVFLPLTHLCRDVCRYCTFAQTPTEGKAPYLSVDEAVKVAHQGASVGCREALFTLGDRPETRYRAARQALADMGFSDTLSYLAHVARAVYEQTGLLPHHNPGVMSHAELAMLRPTAASMGIMLESVSERLCQPGGAHYGSPDKDPEIRLACIAAAGKLKIPFTSGILIGIGETRIERIQSLFALRDLHRAHGHLQEVIIQNFRAKPGTLMAGSVEPDLDDLLWTISMARLIFPPDMNIQAPPNLSPTALTSLLNAGINDWGGVSPVTADFVNPEAPWPAIEQLRQATEGTGRELVARLPVYPEYLHDSQSWIAEQIRPGVRAQQDADGYARESTWTAGGVAPPPAMPSVATLAGTTWTPADELVKTLDQAVAGERLAESDIVRLFSARGREVDTICEWANTLRESASGSVVRYVVNRNINYTNICYFHCHFCAFSKGHKQHSLRGPAYDLPLDEIVRRSEEAWTRGATEVCLQGGIHPQFTGDTYLQICRAIKAAIPQMHIHAFSPLEVWQGAKTLDQPLAEFLRELKSAGLGSLPGTAAEILDDDIRAQICPDKISTEIWLCVMRTAHQVGLRTTATIMFGHLESAVHWARHLLRIRDLQAETGGFTEFVPLPFVHMDAPIHRTGLTRPGPTWREVLLMHAVARLVLNPFITNIQASWVKLGSDGLARCLDAGVNDLGGSLMNESITRAAGAEHGQEFAPGEFEALALRMHRRVEQRTTLYKEVPAERAIRSFAAPALLPAENTLLRREKSHALSAVQRPG